jgi:hypothetical protein
MIDLGADDAAKVSVFHSLWVGKAGGELLRSSPPLAGASVLMRLQIRFGVVGMSMWLTPYCESASTTALVTAAGEPIVPTSPHPFTPIGVCALGVLCVDTVILGKSSALGMQ